MARVIIKEKREETTPHTFDRKVLEREKAKGKPEVDLFYKTDKTPVENINLVEMREGARKKGEDITTEPIEIYTKIVPVKSHRILVHFFRKKEEPLKQRNAVIFLHGGGFFGGDVETKEYQCKYLAEQSDALVIAPEYRLAPETVFPGQIDDVMATMNWICSHGEALHIDTEKIAVAGESAGGNLAASCCLLDKEHKIKLSLLIYAALDLVPADRTQYHWDYSKYPMDESQKEYIMNRLCRFKQMAYTMEKLYLPEEIDSSDERVSPVYAKDVSDFPKSVIIEAEFDYYKLCNDEFIKKLEAAGKEVDVICYEGLDHGFFDRLGTLPQTADCINEMARYIKMM